MAGHVFVAKYPLLCCVGVEWHGRLGAQSTYRNVDAEPTVRRGPTRRESETLDSRDTT